MNELVFLGICFIALALMVLIRFILGPSVADRAVAADAIDMLIDMALVIFAMYSGRGVFLDIAIVTALLGFVATTMVGKYLEGRL
jgi:multisubunit Na+/H+ antiporter MnhF subunit